MIEVVGLRKVFPNGHEALKKISFRVEPGECVAIVGRSGAADPIPESPRAYRGDLDPALVERIRRAFLGFHEAVDPQVIGAILDDNGARYVTVEDSLYDPLRDVVTVLNLNLEELAG